MSAFPVTRLRRLRRTSGLRSLVRETRLDLDDFVMPLFVGPEPLANPDLPGLARHSVETLGGEADELLRLGVRGVILFGIPEEKDEEGSGAAASFCSPTSACASTRRTATAASSATARSSTTRRSS